MQRRFPALLLLSLLGASAAMAQPGADPATVVSQVEAAYENLEYGEAEARARSALARFEVFTPDQLVRLHTTLGLILYARGDELEASEQFRAALSLDPELTLDPLLVSPVTLAFFEDTKATLIRESDTAAQDSAPTVRYIRLEDPRPAATWRSAVLPGWGQRYKGETAKGWILTGLAAATAAGTLTAHLQYEQAHQEYLDERDPTRIPERDATQNRWYDTRGVLALGMAAVWLYAAADAVLVGGPGEASEAALQLRPTLSGARLQWRF
ncbi:MAG: hypothetical protein HKN04_06780 [Rhodothermaceae bacterium]|nr:hypothetical protein [Rhodothermaceae bacterium]